MERIVVVGASLAGLRAAERLRAEGFAGTLTLLGAEPDAPYDRPPLSKELLVGTRGAADIALRVAGDLAADWMLGQAATGLDLERRVVRTAAGTDLPFDGLVIATGMRPRVLPALDHAARNVFVLRTLEHARALRAALLREAGRLLIVGSGFIGVEVASAARALGAEVTMVSLEAPLAAAGEAASAACAALLAEHGVVVHAGRLLVESMGAPQPRAVILDDGARVDFDLAVVAVGAVPCTEWLAGSGVVVDDGVVCDACSAAIGQEGIVAAGDAARWPNPRFGGRSMRIEHWANAVEHGAAAARTLLHGRGPEREYAPLPSFWSDHFGTRLQSVGLPALGDRVELVEGSVGERRFAAASYLDGRLIGAVTYGIPRALARYRVELGRQFVRTSSAE